MKNDLGERRVELSMDAIGVFFSAFHAGEKNHYKYLIKAYLQIL